MAGPFCEHLKEYEELYELAEAAGRQCNETLVAALESEADPERMVAVSRAIEDWLAADRVLREALVELVVSGAVKIPKKKYAAKRRRGFARCAECGFRIPKLKITDWEFAGNGIAAFRGEEFTPPEPVETA